MLFFMKEGVKKCGAIRPGLLECALISSGWPVACLKDPAIQQNNGGMRTWKLAKRLRCH